MEKRKKERTFVALNTYRDKMMEKVRKIPKEQIVMAFVATCIEATARFLGVDYSEIFRRMNRAGMIEGYILPNYEALHCESRDVLAERLVECLNNWEKE